MSGSLDYFDPFSAAKGTGSYFSGIQTGYQVVTPSRMLLGIEADISFPNTIQGTQIIASPAIGLATYSEQVLTSGTVRAKLGGVFDGFALYGTAGLAWSYDVLTRAQAAGTPVGGYALPGDSEGDRVTRLGWSVGAGADVPLSPQWSASLQYIYSSFGGHSAGFNGGNQRFSSDMTLQDVRLGLNYHFGAAGTEPAGAPAPAQTAPDWFAIHGQATYVHQYDFGFRSPYRGQNSLVPGQSRETADATLYVGLRLWQGAELWVNPEIDQGFGIAGTLGAAGYTSGEAYKVGAKYPYTRLPRTFVRQTIDLDGEREKVEGGINQLAGTHTANRLVFTIGKFGVTDVFDSNRFAHDPRTDFLNWSLLDTGSFDYAADAWGYTYGAAVEWYQGRWTLRAGLFDLSIVPNSTKLDPTFKQFQTVAEIERRHEINGQPGRIAITGFLSRGRMGEFTDAVRLAQMTGAAADTSLVRRTMGRTGVSMNLEQSVTPEIGLFVRAGVADGSVEPFDFTDIDRTLAGGFSLKGELWGRPGHELGIGAVLNGIASQHQAYLNAGGLGILVGDGRLPRPAAEKILETYYNIPVWGSLLTLDYQYLVNPAYNGDRGPVSVIGTRVRSFF